MVYLAPLFDPMALLLLLLRRLFSLKTKSRVLDAHLPLGNQRVTVNL